MHNKATQAAKRDQERQLEGIQRLELLMWRFNEAEIQSLSLLQLLHRQRPNALDLLLEESRLHFARWLVEHGRLSEDTESGLVGQPCAEEASANAPCQGSASAPFRGTSSGDPASGPKVGDAEMKGPEQWHLVLLGAWSRVRRGMAKVAEFGRELVQSDYPPGDGGTWGPYGVYDPYGPRGDARSITDTPWFWMRFRHDG